MRASSEQLLQLVENRQGLQRREVLHVDLLLSVAPLLLDFPSDAAGNGFAPLPLPNSPSLVGAVFHAQGIWPWTACSLPPLDLSSSSLISFTIGDN